MRKLRVCVTCYNFGKMRVIIQVCTSKCHHLEPSKGASMEQHGQQMGTLVGTRLNMDLKPQQTAEMNTVLLTAAVP